MRTLLLFGTLFPRDRWFMVIVDDKGRSWVLQLNFRTLCRIEDETGWKVLENPLGVPSSIRAWGMIAGIALESQIKEKGIDADDFAEGWCGPQFQALIDGFITELAVFFEGPKPGMAALLRKTLELQHQAVPILLEEVNRVSEQASCGLRELLTGTHGGTPSGN